MRMHLCKSILTACLALAGLPHAAAAAGAPGDTIRYGLEDAQNFSRLPQVIAERKGFFAREGLTIAYVAFTNTFRSGGANAAPITLREGMKNGSVDMARQQFPLLIGDVMGGGGNTAVSTVASDPIYFLLARPEIRSFADLKGKTVIATGPVDGITIWTRKLLALHGLKDGDYKLTAVPGNDGRIQCMKARMCDAGTVPQPAMFDGRAAGFHVLGVVSEIGVPLLQVEIANAAWARDHGALIGKYIRANTAAMQFIADPKNREELVRVTAEFTKQPENIAREMVRNATDAKAPVFPKTAALDMDGIRAAIALLGEYGVLKQPLPPPERFADPRFALGPAR